MTTAPDYPSETVARLQEYIDQVLPGWCQVTWNPSKGFMVINGASAWSIGDDYDAAVVGLDNAIDATRARWG